MDRLESQRADVSIKDSLIVNSVQQGPKVST